MVRYVASLSALALFAACAFPSIDFRPADEDDAGPSSSSGGLGGMGGTGGSPSVGGGGGEPSCTPGDPNACPGQKCSADENTGVIGCYTAGDRQAWSKCFSDADCVNGTFCDGDTKICHPVCESSAQCGPGQQCIFARGAQLQTLSLKMCTSNCSPLDASPCDDTQKTTCYYDVQNALWDCTETTGLEQGEACTGKKDCNRGLVCVAGGTCEEWCYPIDDFCGAGLCFAPMNISPEWQGNAIGICSKF